MTTYVLDLNDAELRFGRRAGKWVSAPGYAVLADDVVLFGTEVIKQFRVNLWRATNQFWHRLSTEGLFVRAVGVASHADLVYRHLQALATQAEIGTNNEL